MLLRSINTKNPELLDYTEVEEPIQRVVGTSKHTVNTQYRILSKNDFGIRKNRVNLGLFNKKTDFRVSEDKSILFLDKNLQFHTNVKDALSNMQNNFIIYRYSFNNASRNVDSINIYNKNTETESEVELTYEFGKKVGQSVNNEIKFNTFQKIFRDKLLEKNKLNKQLIANTNYNFQLGFLKGILEDNTIPNNFNVYSISLLLNLLEASYSIRKSDGLFLVRFKFSPYHYKILKEDAQIISDFKYNFRKFRYYIDYKNKRIFSSFNPNILNNIDEKDLFNSKIELIPCTDLIFEKIEAVNEDKEMFDLIMDVPIQDGSFLHNFSLDGMPFVHNSDGDQVGVFGIFTKEAAQDADKNFSPHNKTKFKHTGNLSIHNWGVKTDSQLGLYNATK